MLGKTLRWFLIVIAVAAVALGAWMSLRPQPPMPASAEAVPRIARIHPDYAGIVIPPNIAPLNFVVQEEGRRFAVRISGEAGEPIKIAGTSASIRIPRRRWQALLAANRGKDLHWEIFVEADGRWRRYEPAVNHVAREEIDGHLVYRLIGPVQRGWSHVAIWQRDLTGFEESLVIDGSSFGDGCVNCHSFAANSPDRMFVGVRSHSFGNTTLFAEGGQVTKLATRFGYTAWHPSARLAAYSSNKVRQFFHAAGLEARDVIDLKSALAYYCVDSQESKPVPGVSDEQHLTTYPAWSPDGKVLYYCRAPILWSSEELPPERYADVRYSLMRVSYDLDTDTWGSAETVLSAEETGLSILQPRPSPDGRFLLFCMCQYGCFPVYQPTSDLYLMNLATGEWSKCAVNSELSESWHSWSSNSRWVAFSSKRRDGTFTRCYLSFVDEAGQLQKPFIVPREDPEFYDSFLKTISVPELVTGAVQVHPAAMTRAVRSGNVIEPASSSVSGSGVEDTLPYQENAR